ncbi:MAG: phytoene desaturase [Fimbriimonadaceae bacterium]|nr:phytoene desaturase [Fimbriimonadaceae bacterium]
MSQKSIVVVGAGLGGLALALRLAHRGHRVTVLEKNDEVGGRARPVQVGDCRFDGGPTLLMMLDPFRKLFADVGERFEDHVPIRRCDPTYRVFYADGNRIDATTDASAMRERLRALAGDRDADAYPGFLDEIGRLYHEAVPHFVRKNYRTLGDFASIPQLRRVLGHRMLGKLGRRVHARFMSEHARMLFSFQTMYLGLSPFQAPWVYATLAYMEYGEGVYYPQGGIAGIVEAVTRLAIARGVVVRTGCPVRSIVGDSVELESGERLQADAIVANADMPYAQRELAGTPTKRKLRYSCSAQLLYIDYEGELEELQHHNVFFGADFRANLDALFGRLRVPKDPAFYACVSKRSDSTVAPDGRLNLLLLVPVPNLDRPMTSAEESELEREVLGRLRREVGLDPAGVREIARRGPREWQGELNLDRGAAFGIGHDLFQSAFMRPQNRSRENPSLFFVGASTVPGNGMPMVLISAELAERRMLEEGVLAS